MLICDEFSSVISDNSDVNMSQALLAYTLPNGTQVLIPTFDEKEVEIMPMVVYGDRTVAETTVNSDANVLLPGIQVALNDLDSMMDTSSTLERAASDEIVLRTNNMEHSDVDSGVLKCDGKQNIFENAIVVNSELNEIIELQKSADSSRDSNIVREILLRTQQVESKDYDSEVEDQNVGLCVNDSENCLNSLESDKSSSKYRSSLLESICIEENGRIETISLERVNINDILKKYRPLDISLKQVERSSISSEIDSFGSDYDSHDSSSQNEVEEHTVSLKPSIKELRVAENRENNVTLVNYVEGKGGRTENHSQLPEPVVSSSSDSILHQACTSVELSLENGEYQETLEGHSNNALLENLDDFAEMVMWFRCRLCKFAAGNKEELLDHLRTKHLEGNSESDAAIEVEKNVGELQISKTEGTVSEKLVFLCGQCSAGFNSIEACKTHMMEVHELIVQENEEENDGQILEEENDDISNITEENTGSNSKKYLLNQKPPVNLPFKCSVRGCQSKFSDEKDVAVHVSCHADSENNRDFRCCECQAPFERWRTCAMHLWKVHNIDCGLLTCPICLKYKTATSVPLENHMRIHGEARSFTCPECGKGFKQAAQLHNHRIMHIDRKTSELPRWYATKQCDICFKNYANSKCLKKHVQAVHSKLRPYVCQVCGHASARKAMLQLHYRQHTGEKPHSCPLCDYRTGDHNSLRRHIMRHTGQRPYRCPHCPYSAIQSNSYKNHLRNKHPGQSGVFACSQCSFKTVSHEGYLLHVSDHKNGIITSNYNDGNGNDVEVFPGNVAAAQLIYQCLNALSSNGITVEANMTGSSTSADGTTQTITIQIPNQECSDENNEDDDDDDDVAHCFLEVKQKVEQDVGMIGIIIPKDTEHNTLCHMVS